MAISFTGIEKARVNARTFNQHARTMLMEEMDIGLAARLRAVKVEFEINTNEALGRICGAKKSAVNNWLIGGNGPKVREMARLCDEKGLSLDWIYRGKVATMDLELSSRLELRIATGNIKLRSIRNVGASRVRQK
jgi:hypothetical protein